ncbi:MAG TPA: HPF/RaiA family ribosome-associated protein [Candidatus Limnocylindrales bacterium]|nr:HPF/RaiA family ribosome-associated protein [Candidatus Limnocylindrales bacterium]
MEIPLQIRAHNVSLSEADEKIIREKVAKLEEFYDRIISCRVTLEALGRHHQKGGPYNVRIDIGVPGAELVINREPQEDLYVAIRESFNAAGRRLEDYVRRLRGTVKTHEAEPHARVSKLFPEEGYGFLETPDGREIYFHRNSVLEEGFKHLRIGMEVRFVEEEGEKGPQASTVKLVGKHQSV